MDVCEAIEDYRLAHLGLADQTRTRHKHCLGVFAAYCQAHELTLESIKGAHIRAFLEEVKRRPGKHAGPVRLSTVRVYAQTVKAFFAWLSREEDFERLVSPTLAKRIDLPKSDEQVLETFTPEQLAAMLAVTADQVFAVRDRAIVAVLIDTGIRASELCGLTIDSVWLDQDDSFIRVRGKGRKERELALGRASRMALRRYLTRYRRAANKTEQHVFLGRRGRPLTVSGLEQLITRLGERAHIKGVRCSPHTIRHTFAVRYLLNGGDLYKLSRLMGHTSVKITERYVASMKAWQARQGGHSVLDHLKGEST
jgi:site-specific recombinase XerD